MVVLAEVDGELAEDFAGGGVDDGHVEVLDEELDVGSGVGSSDADVAEFAVDAEGDDAGVWAAAMFSDSSSPVNWVGKSPGGAIHVS